VVDLDGEWFVKWSPAVPAGETVELSYSLPEDADFDLDVDGVATEKLTVNA
jgi:DNA topoisomerase-6 subunit B